MRQVLAYFSWGSLVPFGALLHLRVGGLGTSAAFLMLIASGLGILYTMVRDDPLPTSRRVLTEEEMLALIASGDVAPPSSQVPVLGPQPIALRAEWRGQAAG